MFRTAVILSLAACALSSGVARASESENSYEAADIVPLYVPLSVEAPLRSTLLENYGLEDYISNTGGLLCHRTSRKQFKCHRAVAVKYRVDAALSNCAKFDGSSVRCAIYRPTNVPARNRAVVAIAEPPWPAPLLSVHELGFFAAYGDPIGMETIIPELNGLPYVWAWVPVEHVINGAQVLQRWRQLADAKTPYDCRKNECSIMVRSPSKNMSSGANGLATCRVAISEAGKLSSPRYCAIVATEAIGQTLLVGVVALKEAQAGYGGRDDFSLEIKKRDQAVFSADALFQQLSEELRAPPFSMEVYEKKERLVASADSVYLNELRMWTLQTVVITKKTIHTAEGDELQMPVATTLYVNSKNSDAANEWHLPSRFVSAAYVGLLKSVVLRASKKLCPTARIDQEGFLGIELHCD